MPKLRTFDKSFVRDTDEVPTNGTSGSIVKSVNNVAGGVFNSKVVSARKIKERSPERFLNEKKYKAVKKATSSLVQLPIGHRRYNSTFLGVEDSEMTL